MHMSYWRFAAMIATSTVVMFGLMYLNTYALAHVYWSETRAWMALLMGATMAIIMLSYMLNMYKNKAVNIGIFIGSVLVFAGSLWLVRSQATITGVDYMKAMIPHHSIAILTSERAQISDPRVRKLADEIIEAQRKEISEMQYLVEDLEGAPQQGDTEAQGDRSLPELVPASEAIQTPELSTTDLSTMRAAEYEKVIGSGPHCRFAYSTADSAILAATVSPEGRVARGAIKIHGRLVEVAAEGTSTFDELAGTAEFTAEGVRISVMPLADSGESRDGETWFPAQLHFELDQGLQADYRGWYKCRLPEV